MKNINRAWDDLRQAINAFLERKEELAREKADKPPHLYIKLAEFRQKYPYIGNSTMLGYCLNDERFKELVWRKAPRSPWWVDEIGCIEVLRTNPRFDKYFQLFHCHAFCPPKNNDE